jgi:hypothetical protein
MGFYVFPKSIKNIDGVMKVFNAQFANPDNFMDFKYGIQGVDYEIVDDKIVELNHYPSDKLINLELKLIINNFSLNSSYVPESLAIIEEFNNNIAYERNVFNHMNTYSTLSLHNTFNFNRNVELEAIFNLDIPLEDAIEYYKDNVRRSGQVEVIYELNKQLGKTTKHGY